MKAVRVHVQLPVAICDHDMLRVADIWSIEENILYKQSRTADKEWS
jgi:hypothetical protein